MARFSFLFVALALASMHGALGAPSCKHKWHGHSMVSHSSFSSLPGDVAQPTNPVETPKANGVPDSNSGTPTPSPTSAPATQPTPTSTPSVAPSSSQPASSGSSGGFVANADIDAYLKGHNDYRAKHGAQPLTWSTELENTAQTWANGCKFEHSHGKYGENIAAGSPTLSISDAIRMWTTDEEKQYDPNSPTYSHFTQVVWKATTQLGCASKTCSGGLYPGSWTYHVCEYNPPGNVIGEFAQNVQP